MITLPVGYVTILIMDYGTQVSILPSFRYYYQIYCKILNRTFYYEYSYGAWFVVNAYNVKREVNRNSLFIFLFKLF